MKVFAEALRNRLILVLGLGETGLSSLAWLRAQGAHLRVADTRNDPPGIAAVAGYVHYDQIFCGALSASLLDDVHMLVLSPGVPLSTPLVQQALALGIEVLGDIELFARYVPKQNVLAITGSNGKTTVTSLVTHLCQLAGKDAVAAGNISPAVLDVVLERNCQQPEIWVLELSSFQLETTDSLVCNAAAILNISEDHLDRYDNQIDLYATAKARLFKQTNLQVFNRDDKRCLAMLKQDTPYISFGLSQPQQEHDFGIVEYQGEIWLVRGSERLLPARNLQLTGLHNVANALAALALCSSLALPIEKLLDGLMSFKGLPHRVEFVANIAGVDYYDDSKGTNVGATVAALQGLQQKIVLIAGGEGKGQDFSPLADAVKQYARAVVLIGQDAPLIADVLLQTAKPVLFADSMKEAVQLASEQAQEGDVVLLSPACASFDMFRNYVHRAEVFIAAVTDLQRESV